MVKPLSQRISQSKLSFLESEQKTKCYAAAIKLLAIREHSHKELNQKLAKKSFPIDVIGQVLIELKAQNLQSDLRYADILVRSRLGKGYGPVYVQYYLKDKGIAADVIESVLDFTDVAWQKALSEAVEKKFGEKKPIDFQQKIKQMNFLQRRGFTSEQIRNYYDTREVNEINEDE